MSNEAIQLKEQIKALKLDRRDLAQKVGLSYSGLCSVLNGYNTLSPRVKERLEFIIGNRFFRIDYSPRLELENLIDEAGIPIDELSKELHINSSVIVGFLEGTRTILQNTLDKLLNHLRGVVNEKILAAKSKKSSKKASE